MMAGSSPTSYIQPQRGKATALPWVVSAFALLFVVVFGTSIGAGIYLATAALALIPIAIYLMMRPAVSLVLIAGLTLLVAGSFKYFLGLGQLQWALSALGAALLAYSLVSILFSRSDDRSSMSGIPQAMALWWAGLVFSTFANLIPAMDWFVGLRIYLPAFGIFLYLAFCRPEQKLLKNIILFMVFIAAVQWMFCLYQKMRVVPIRIAAHYPGSPWDSIVGSFGGEMYGGGESGSLGIYLSLVIVLIIALWKFRQIRFAYFAIAFIASLGAMALVESKVVALMIPLGFLIVYRDRAFTQPLKFLVGSLAVLALMLGLLAGYHYLYWQMDNNLGLIDALYARFAYSFDPYFQASTTNLGRIKSLLFWWNQHDLLDNPLTLFFGHGMASAVSSSTLIGMGSAVGNTGVMLDVTGASKLLWESGLIGTLVFLSMFGFGYHHARSLKSNPLLPPWHRAAMEGVEAAMVLMPLSIFYEVTVVSSPPMQFMAMFLLGYIMYWRREATRGTIE